MIINRIKAALGYFFADSEDLLIENRLFLSAIITGLFVSLLGTIVSIFLSSQLYVLIIIISIFFFLGILYYFVRVKGIFKPLIIPLILISFLAISIIWIFDGGINGADLFVGFVILVLGLILVPGKGRKYIFLLFVTLVIILYLIQLLRPDLITGFTSEKTRWIDSLITVLYSSFFLFLIIRFLHNHYKAEKNRAEKSEAKSRSIMENSADAIFITDQNGRYVYTNKAVTDLLGYSTEEMRSKTLADISPPERLGEYLNLFGQILREGKGFAELELIKKDGTYLASDLNAVLLPNGTVYGSCRDISDRKRAELILIEKERKLYQLNTDKDRFISILGHDLRNPFNNLIGLSEVLTEDIRELDIHEIEKLGNQINKTVRNTYNLLEEILLWARTQQGNIPFEPQNLSLAAICNDILKTLTPNAEIKSITVDHSGTADLTVYADIDMLKTILRNLVSNAIKFTDRMGTVNISATSTDSNVTISVADNGIGIAPDDLKKLFDISQVITTKGTANETGTGIGLLICREFAEKHGGKIWVESEVGTGSNFIFTLPIPSVQGAGH